MSSFVRIVSWLSVPVAASLAVPWTYPSPMVEVVDVKMDFCKKEFIL